ncbi:gapN [Symbiodinium sp. CCMP2592]|nr:gapN [Symbiodinium sp. CCMP2592]
METKALSLHLAARHDYKILMIWQRLLGCRLFVSHLSSPTLPPLPLIRKHTQAMAPQIDKPEVSQDSETFKTKPYVDGAKVLIGGEVKPWTGAITEVFSPVYCTETNQRICIGRQATLSSKEAVKAVEAAAKAWGRGRGEWPRKSLEQRVVAVEKLVEKLKERRSEIVSVLQWEICKNDADAAKEFDRTMDFIGALISAARGFDSTGMACHEGVHALLKRSPIGVMMNLGPSNYPFNETYATLIPAILMGDSVVMKVPNTGGLAHFLTMEAYAECFPAGVVNFVSGRGRDTMPPCMETGLVDVFAFIGSSKAADALVKAHPQPHRLKNLLSLDAKNLAIVMPDADLDVAVKECVAGSTSYNGQRCTAIKLIMVHKSIAEKFNEKFCAAISGLSAGLPFGKSNITPLASSSTEYMKTLTDDATSKGAKVLNEGGAHLDRSLFFPAVVYPVTHEMELWQAEQFGPVIPIAPYESIDEPIAWLEKMHFGQQSAIFTSQEATQPDADLAELLDVCALSTCRVNLNAQCQRGPDVYPFAGRRSSAMGTISVEEVLRAVSVETMVAGKKPEVIRRACQGSTVFANI